MFDLSIFNFIHGLAGQSRLLDWLGIFLADYLGYVLIFAVLVLILKTRRRFQFFAFVILSALLSRGLLTEFIRFIYSRPRPPLVAGINPLIDYAASASFPSGHAALYFALAFAVWHFNRRWGYWFLLGAALIGVARVLVGVHWPLDILGGALLGLLSAIVVKWILPEPESV